jgi:predicted Zn-dependent protease
LKEADMVRPSFQSKALRFSAWLVLAAVLHSAPSAAQTRIRPGFNLFTVQQDVQVGAQSASEIERRVPIVRSGYPAVYVERVGRRLAAQAPGADYPYRFRIANLSDVNAFALPGGYVYVHRGLIEQVRTEGELAGVIAHEIAHVALRHPTSQASKAYVTRAGFGLLGSLLGDGRQNTVGGIMNAVGGVGMNALFLKYSRNAETQADVVGAQIMARAGYDPNEMANFFAYLERQSSQRPSLFGRFLSDHPPPANRASRVRREAQLVGATQRSAPVGDLIEAQTWLRRLPRAPTLAQVTTGD